MPADTDHMQGGEVLPYLADRFDWAAPGDQQEDAWLVRFSDKDCGEAIFTGADAEREAWEYWNRYAPGFNIYVFRLARLHTAALSHPAPESDPPARVEDVCPSCGATRDGHFFCSDGFHAPLKAPAPVESRAADEGEVERVARCVEMALVRHGVAQADIEGTLDDADTILAALTDRAGGGVIPAGWRRYVQHLPGCRMRKAMGQSCVCGLSSLLSAAPITPSGEEG